MQALREGDRRKDEALAALAHEVRNPLSAIVNACQALRLEAADGSRSAELCELVVRQSRRMVRLAGELIESSPVSTAHVELERVDITRAIGRAVEAVTHAIEARQHQIVVAPPREPLAIVADPFRLEQILVNLLLNAAQYTDPGGTISLDAWQDGRLAAIRVSDTGAGISAELLPRVFDPFVRGANDSSDGGAPYSLGLGLALAKRFAEQHGGTLTAASDGRGRGSAFTIRLPMAQSDGVKRPAGERDTAKADAHS
jgi:signal transduction histidine kinase